MIPMNVGARTYSGVSNAFEIVIETTLVDEIVTLPFSVGFVVDAIVDWGR